VNAGCLAEGESEGMGEGWGVCIFVLWLLVPGVCYVVMTLCWSNIDFLATIMMSTRDGGDYPIAAWAANKDNVIGFYPYSVVSAHVPSSFCIISNHLTFASHRTKQPIPQPMPPSTPQGTLTNHTP